MRTLEDAIQVETSFFEWEKEKKTRGRLINELLGEDLIPAPRFYKDAFLVPDEDSVQLMITVLDEDGGESYSSIYVPMELFFANEADLPALVAAYRKERLG